MIIFHQAYSVSFDFGTTSSFQNSIFVAYEDHKVRRWKFDSQKLTLEAEFIAHVDHCKHILVNSAYGCFVTCGRVYF